MHLKPTPLWTWVVVITTVLRHKESRSTNLSNGLLGPYTIELKAISECDDKGTNEMKMPGSKIYKVNRTTVTYSSPFILPYGLSDNVEIGVDSAVFGNGGWRENSFTHNFGGICSTFEKFAAKPFHSLLMLLDRRDNCPLPPGNYTLKQAIIGDIRFAVDVLPYGLYRVDLWFSHKEKKIGCKRFTISVDRQKRRKKSR